MLANLLSVLVYLSVALFEIILNLFLIVMIILNPVRVEVVTVGFVPSCSAFIISHRSALEIHIIVLHIDITLRIYKIQNNGINSKKHPLRHLSVPGGRHKRIKIFFIMFSIFLILITNYLPLYLFQNVLASISFTIYSSFTICISSSFRSIISP